MYITRDEKDNYNETILNGLRLSKGIKTSDLKEYSDIINKTEFNKVIDKWDCLSISDKNIRLTKEGFLFVDEISTDMFL